MMQDRNEQLQSQQAEMLSKLQMLKDCIRQQVRDDKKFEKLEKQRTHYKKEAISYKKKYNDLIKQYQ